MYQVESADRRQKKQAAMMVFHRAEVKEQLAVSRALRIEELTNSMGYEQMLDELKAKLMSLRAAVDELVGLNSNQHKFAIKKTLATELRELKEVLLAKSEISASLIPIFESVLPILETILHFSSSETGLVTSCLSFLESITYQMSNVQITGQILSACMRYIGIIIETANPSVCVAYAVNFSNILGNCLMSCEDLTEVDLNSLRKYQVWLLNLMRLKKSSDFARNTIWLTRALILRFSCYNPRNITRAEAVCKRFSEIFLFDFNLAEACSLGLDYYYQNPITNQCLLVEVLWTLAFSAKHSELNQSIYDKQLFCKLTELVLGDQFSYSNQNLMLPYLSYLGSVVAAKQSAGMLSMVGEDNMKIFNQLTAILQEPAISRAIIREAMYVICSYLGSGINIQLAEITVSAMAGVRSITEDEYFDKEMFFIHLTFLKICLNAEQTEGDTFSYACQVARQKLSKVSLSAAEMIETDKAFSSVLKYLRSKKDMI